MMPSLASCEAPSAGAAGRDGGEEVRGAGVDEGISDAGVASRTSLERRFARSDGGAIAWPRDVEDDRPRPPA